MSKIKHSAFYIAYNSLARQLVTNVIVIGNGKPYEVNALWDTGASITCVSHDVVKILNLNAISKKTINTPSGQSEVFVYLVSIGLPNKVIIPYCRVCDSEIGEQGIGVLIGMDIISCGDFAVTNCNNKTSFTFCIPSRKVINFVNELKPAMSHGQGKRKHKRK